MVFYDIFLTLTKSINRIFGFCIFCFYGLTYSKQTNYALHQLRFDEKNESQENNERLLEGKNCLVGICPNPANDIVRVTGKQLERIEIINVMGQRIISHYVGGEDSIYIDLGNVPSGIYFISVMDKVGNSCVKRLIKR